jgi:hypothetical protein
MRMPSTFSADARSQARSFRGTEVLQNENARAAIARAFV